MKKTVTTTMLKFFFSYLFLFCLSALCFYFCFRSNLIRTLTEQYDNQLTRRIEDTVVQLSDDILSLHVMNDNIIHNADIVMAKYSNSKHYNPIVSQELKKYVSSQTAVISAIYIDRRNGVLYSSGKGYYISYTDGLVILRSDDATFVFDPLTNCSTSADTLLALENNGKHCLIYVPVNFPYYNYMAFYILNPNAIAEECADIVIESVTACALISPSGQPVVGVSTFRLPDCATYMPGVHHIDANSTLFISDPISGGFMLAALSTTDSLKISINEALRDTIPFMIVIMIAGVLLAVAFTYVTYTPIHKLASRIHDNDIDENEPIKKIDIAIRNQYERNSGLEERVNYYRTFIQKSLLDSIISISGKPTTTFDELDSLFSPDVDRSILIVAVKNAPISDIDFGNNELIVLSTSNDVTVCLINHINVYPDDSFATSMLSRISVPTSALIGISSTASSALDIPKLYEQAIAALSHADANINIVSWTPNASFVNHTSDYSYPNALLEQFSKNAKACDLKEARASFDSLFSLLMSFDSHTIGFPEFYIRSVLIDLLSELMLTMNDMSIKFSKYDDLFFETLYLCRSGTISDLPDIRNHFLRLLSFFGEQIEMVYINAGTIKAIVSENISNPDFSITTLYSQYNISVAYMSYLFKKETGENFSDYLWKARFEKACEMLKEGNHSIDEISIAVGYLHTSSFRRKFKQETGFSPADYQP